MECVSIANLIHIIKYNNLKFLKHDKLKIVRTCFYKENIDVLVFSPHLLLVMDSLSGSLPVVCGVSWPGVVVCVCVRVLGLSFPTLPRLCG